MAEAKATKTPLTAEKKARRRAAKVVGWAVWSDAFRAANPKATKEERRAAWNVAKGQNKRLGSKVVKALEKRGYELNVKPAPVAAE